MKKWTALLLALLMLLSLFGCGGDTASDLPVDAEVIDAYLDAAAGAVDLLPEIDETHLDDEDKSGLDEAGWYYSADDVSQYLHSYGHLPGNYITKDAAGALGWEGGSVEDYAPGCAIGGDRFGNREGLLPDAEGRVYFECDIDTDGAAGRGAKRLVFSNDGLIYYTEDHYESFTLLYGEE